MQDRCERCGLGGSRLNGTVCELCHTDQEVLAALSEWSASEAAEDILRWDGESFAGALEYEIFMLTMEKLGARFSPPDGGS
ncbi:MAG: hypothetical protein HYT87_00940 [Nitrospirae bacterium]|nr:hypothetical protein [Nitrospirota bacterium]